MRWSRARTAFARWLGAGAERIARRLPNSCGCRKIEVLTAGNWANDPEAEEFSMVRRPMRAAVHSSGQTLGVPGE
jgi:hypothetical protein